MKMPLVHREYITDVTPVTKRISKVVKIVRSGTIFVRVCVCVHTYAMSFIALVLDRVILKLLR